jgi:two-component system, OmpR family, sensor kinase
MRRRWQRAGLRSRLALSIGAIVVLAFAVVFVAVRAQMANESAVIQREEGREQGPPPGAGGEGREGPSISPIDDAQSDVEKTFLGIGGVTLVAALLAGYLLAARTASPLRRFAATASEIDAGDLTPRLESSPGDAAELRVLAEAFNNMLDRLDQAFAKQRQFVSDASHELRSPLTAIRGQLEVLARQERPEEQEVRRVEAVAVREIGRVERLVEDMLSLARLDEGVGPALQEVSAAGFLRDVVEARQGGSEQLGDLAEGTIQLDPDLVAQVVHNLLDNADRYASAEGHVLLSARPDGDSLVISVEDAGPGIPPAERERVFDRFHRRDLARDRASGGSGLGLGIARAIVVAHGGHIWVDDSPLGGAQVSFSLPRFSPR